MAEAGEEQMKIRDTDDEYYLGSVDRKPQTIEEAQEMAGTQDEDQDEDPEMSVEEERWITGVLGFDPLELDDDEEKQ
jgi:hypothetical protein